MHKIWHKAVVIYQDWHSIRHRLKVIILAVMVSLVPLPALSEGVSLIKDAEIEAVLKSYLQPLFKANGLPADSLKVYLVNDNSINAFATSRYSIFVHTGLILSASSVGEVIGVLAHETGHIAGGHIVRLYSNMKVASATSLVSTILGTAAAILTGRPDVGVAIMMSGQNMALASHMQYRQSEENAADESATKSLRKLGYSSKGFLEMMKKLIANEKITMGENQITYLRTHPLTEDRAKFLTNVLQTEDYPLVDMGKQERDFQIIKAKLVGFLYNPFKVHLIYKPTDKSFPARYANVIADFRMGNVDTALQSLNLLLEEQKENPYLYELKGQVLFESGRIKEAIEPYQTALKYAGDSDLIRLSLAFAMVESGQEDLLPSAIEHIEKLTIQDKNNPEVWRLYSIAAARQDDMTTTYYAMAEYNFLLGDYPSAKDYADKAKIKLKPETKTYIKLMDLMLQIDNKLTL